MRALLAAPILLVPLVLLAMDAPPPAGDSLAFEVQPVNPPGETNMGLEPTFDYLGTTVWYSGMNGTLGGGLAWEGKGNLWHRHAGAQHFTYDPPPNRTGGVDAVVHVGVLDRVFFAEQNPIRIVTRSGDIWGNTYEPTSGDRPWFMTADGTTYLSFTTDHPRKTLLLRYQPASDSWTYVHNTNNPISDDGFMATDAVGSPDGRLTLLQSNANALRLAVREPQATAWDLSATLNANLDGCFGMPRLALDQAGQEYVVWGEQRNGNKGMHLSTRIAGAWTEPAFLGSAGKTGTLGSIAAGAPGVLGVAWYQTGDALPPCGDAGSIWDVVYARFTGASDGLPEPTHATVVEQGVLCGKLEKHVAGDFTFTATRGDDPTRVAVAYVRGEPSAAPPSCGSLLLSAPMFAVQTGGPGLV